MFKRYRWLWLLVVVAAIVTASWVGFQAWGSQWHPAPLFSGAATAGSSTSPDGRWRLELAWRGDTTVDVSLLDVTTGRRFARTIVIADTEYATNNDGTQQVAWDESRGTVTIGNETVHLP